jgi:hypothetical protein
MEKHPTLKRLRNEAAIAAITLGVIMLGTVIWMKLM